MTNTARARIPYAAPKELDTVEEAQAKIKEHKRVVLVFGER